MTTLAFYAPMKHPDHPVASGDRAMARGLLKALDHAGYITQIASVFQSRDGKGDPEIQEQLIRDADAEKKRVTELGEAEGWAAWVTYHNYYKAPDLIGPAVCRALDIPYLLVESTRARKRLVGTWAAFAQIAEAATDQAAVVMYPTRRDADALHAYARADQRLVHLAPFLARSDLPPATSGSNSIISVGMMRKGDKLASYQLIAETLRRLRSSNWTLNIVGDGPAREDVHTLMSNFGNRVRFLGALDAEGVQNAYCTSSLLLWPGVNEAFGMTYLEAQAAGLAVVAQNRPGVIDILDPTGHYPDPNENAAGLAERLDSLLCDPQNTASCGASARNFVAQNHLIGGASATLKKTIDEVLA